MRFRRLQKNSLLITYQLANLILTVRCRPGCGTYHSGGLIVCQFLNASLSGYYVTDLDKKKRIMTFRERHQR